MKAQLIELIDEKLELIERTKTQMAPDVEAGILPEGVPEIVNMAMLNFNNAKEKISVGTDKAMSEALFLFGRGNWNLGEFQANVKIIKKKQEG